MRLTQDRDHWCVLVNMVVILNLTIKTGLVGFIINERENIT